MLLTEVVISELLDVKWTLTLISLKWRAIRLTRCYLNVMDVRWTLKQCCVIFNLVWFVYKVVLTYIQCPFECYGRQMNVKTMLCDFNDFFVYFSFRSSAEGDYKVNSQLISASVDDNFTSIQNVLVTLKHLKNVRTKFFNII